MKILLIIPTEYKGSRWGGVMTYTLSQANELKNLSHEVTILTPGEKNELFIDQSVSIIKIAYTKTRIPTLPFVWRFFPVFIDRMKWMMSVYAFINSHDSFDVIESPEWGSSTLLLSLKGNRAIVTRMHKSLLQYHSDNNLPITPDIRLVNCLEMLSTILSGGITSPTRYIIKSHPVITWLGKLFQTPIVIIPNGVSLNIKLGYERTKTPYILTVGRLERGKGQLLLIRAFAQISNRIPSVNLIIIGRDTDDDSEKNKNSFKKKLLDEIVKSQLKKRVVIKNQMTQSELVPYYKRCLLYVAPAIGHENHPIALLDAINWGKAVIGSDTGGIPEIINHGKNGLLFKTNDPSSLAKKLKYLIQKNTIRKQFEKNNQIYRQHFDIQRTAKLALNFYHKIQQAR